jgi:hypothetical protein
MPSIIYITAQGDRHEVDVAEGTRAAEQEAFAVYLESVTADARLPEGTRADCAVAVWALGRGMTAMRASQPDGKLPQDTDESLARGIAWMLDRPG